MNAKVYELKMYLKNSAAMLREMKNEHKKTQRETRGAGLEGELYRARRDYRHKHIAYCLIRGKEYKQIESPASDNQPDWAIIREDQNAYTASSDVCACTI